MTIRFATAEEITTWDTLLLKNPRASNILQTTEMSDVKQRNGWKIRRIIVGDTATTVQEKYIFGIGKLWYVPKGPSVLSAAALAAILPELKEFARSKGVFLIKIEPELQKSASTLRKMKQLEAIQASPIQPNTHTVIVDLSNTIDDMMLALPQKTRHAIKRAGRDGCIIKNVPVTTKNIDVMFALMSETMSDKEVRLRTQQYYADFWTAFAEKKMGNLFIAYDNDTPIAGAYVLTFGETATYKDGGSLKKKTIYGASHALQWYIIEWLKAHDVSSYDLCGTPPADEIANQNHPYYGIGLFKTGFNKTVTEFIGVYDVVINTASYGLWSRIAERVVFNLHSRVLKKYFY